MVSSYLGLLSQIPLEALHPHCCICGSMGIRWKVLDTAVNILPKGKSKSIQPQFSWILNHLAWFTV